jgi:DNA-binding beta-propeller fold protein YncE
MNYRPHLCLLIALFAPLLATAETLLIANKSEASLNLIDLASGNIVRTLATGEGPHEIAVSPDGSRAVVTNYGAGTAGNSLTVIDIAAGRVTGSVDLGEYARPHGALFLPDGRRVLVTAEAAQSVVLVDLDSGRVGEVIPTGQSVSHMVAYDSRMGIAYVSNIGSGSVTRLDIAGGRLLGSRPIGGGAEGIALSRDGRDLWVAARDDDELLLLDPASLELRARLEIPGFPIRVEMSADDRQVLVTSARSGALTVVDSERQKVIRTVELAVQAGDEQGRLFADLFGRSSTPIGIEAAPDGRRVWITHAGADVVQELEVGQWPPMPAPTWSRNSRWVNGGPCA